MLSRQERVKKLSKRLKENCNDDFFRFTEESLEIMIEQGQQASEQRFGKLKDTATAIQSIRSRTQELASNKAIVVNIAYQPSQIPKTNRDAGFKYALLGECRSRMQSGEDIAVALVCENELVIGYGIAKRTSDATFDIEIIDVETASRRSNGLEAELKIEGQKFTVGIGHVIVLKLLESLQGKLKTDATHDSSRYIFKSLGFVSVSKYNPCLLGFQSEA